MPSNNIKLLVDAIVVLIGFYAVYKGKQAAMGGLFGQAMTFILVGISVLTLNHALDTVFLADFLKRSGHTQDLLQSTAVHRYINLVGFVLVAIGFSKIAKTQDNK